MTTRDEELPTAVEGDGTPAGRAVRRLRARWLEPSPPLAVDDEPARASSPDGPEDEPEGDALAEGPVPHRVAH